MNIKKVSVIGGGIMGNGIAQVAATAGFSVVLNDIEKKFLDNARSNIEVSLGRILKKGTISENEKKSILEKITFTIDFNQALSEADVIIEAIPENINLKKDLFKELDGLTKPGVILATNTSQYSITEIASVVADPSRVIGMHFFHPPVVMNLIEIVRGLETSDDCVARVLEFSKKLGKETVVCKDSQGFISTRLVMALRLECYRVWEEGIATKEDIDKTLRLAFRHPMGQFELADFSGLDIELSASEGLYKTFGERFRPPQQLKHLINAGRLGRKSGRGWYDYTK